MDNLNYLFQLLHTPSPCLLLSLVQTMNTGKWFPTSFKLTALTCYGLLLLWGTYAMPSCLSGFPSLSGTPPSQGAKPINVQLDNSPRNQQEWTLFLRASGKAPTSTPGLKFCFYHKNVFCGILNSSKLPSRQATTHCDRTQFSLGQLVPSGVLLPAHHEKHERETLLLPHQLLWVLGWGNKWGNMSVPTAKTQNGHKRICKINSDCECSLFFLTPLLAN